MRKTVAPIYQPIVDVDSSKVLYYEALARLKNGGGAADGHLRLIEMGEALGFIDILDVAMLDYAAETLRGNAQVVVAVNVSGATIEHSLNDLLAMAFKHMEVMDRVVFEMTETCEIRDAKMLTRFLAAARLLEARVALDDFGEGFCTTAFVEQIKPEFVKLAGNVVSAGAAGETRPIREVSALVRGYGGSLIAEHIDSQAKAEAVRRLGVRYMQGFWIGEGVADIAKAAPCVETAADLTSKTWRPARAGAVLPPVAAGAQAVGTPTGCP